MDERYRERYGFLRLSTAGPVWFAEDACLIVRRPGMSCNLCKEACPTAALSGNQWSVALEADGCIGCGLCSAACPTGALQVEGFAPAQRVTGENQDFVTLECRRVPAARRDPRAVVVPCLGGLTVPDILDFSVKGAAAVALQDHGWCEACPVGGCSRPWDVNLESAKSILDQIKPGLSTCLQVDTTQIPVEEAESIGGADLPSTQSNRRHFFRRLAGLVSPHDAKESKRIVFGRGAVNPIQREQILATVREIAEELDGTVPSSLMPAIEIGEACDLHGICAAICPTEALQKLTLDDGGMAIQFDAEKCISCGECQRVCPNKALSLRGDGDGELHRYPVTLMSRRTQICGGCGASFVPARDGQDELCTLCNRSIDLMRNMSDFLSGRHLTS